MKIRGIQSNVQGECMLIQANRSYFEPEWVRKAMMNWKDLFGLVFTNFAAGIAGIAGKTSG